MMGDIWHVVRREDPSLTLKREGLMPLFAGEQEWCIMGAAQAAVQKHSIWHTDWRVTIDILNPQLTSKSSSWNLGCSPDHDGHERWCSCLRRRHSMYL